MPVAASSRVVLYGATGYTGELTAREMVRRGMRPVLAGRARKRLEKLAAELGGLEVARRRRRRAARASRRSSSEGDVLVTTVGPFARWGEPALMAALTKRAHYLDSTGESTFVRRVFESARAARGERGRRAADGDGLRLGARATSPARWRCTRPARTRGACGSATSSTPRSAATGIVGAISGGTRATAAGAMLDSGFAFRDGRLVDERPARRVAQLRDARRAAASRRSRSAPPSTSRCRGSPPQLVEVDVYLGWFGAASRPMQAMTSAPGPRAACPDARPRPAAPSRGASSRAAAAARRRASRARVRSLVIASAYDGDGNELCRVRLEGPNGYDLTAAFLAWGAERAAAGALLGDGALGPVEASGSTSSKPPRGSTA